MALGEPSMSALTAADARVQHVYELEARRGREAACALDFLVYGDGESGTFLGHRVQGVTHAERCVFGARHACARTYDPMPYDEAEPVDLRMYEGTAIGALYGLSDDAVTRTWLDDDGNAVTVTRPLLELEGWELAPRTVFE